MILTSSLSCLVHAHRVPLSLRTPSEPHPSSREQQPCNPRHGRLFGRLAEPNTPLSPPGSEVDDEQMRDMLASPLYLQERDVRFTTVPAGERSKCRPTTCLSLPQINKNSMSRSSRFGASAGKPAAVFSHKRKSSQESHSDRDGIPVAHRAVQRENEALFRLCESESGARLILEEQRDQLLSEAKSEVQVRMKNREGGLCCS